MGLFPDQAMAEPLYVRSAEGLARKLENADGLLKKYWGDFQNRILADPKQRGQMLFLPALLPDKSDIMDEAAGHLRDYWRNLKNSDTANDVQFHTWCRGGSVTRRVAFFDWLAHQDYWSKAELEEAAEAFTGFAYKHSLQVMNGRRRASDNQVWSMALNCAVTGFIFGHKLSSHAIGKHLFDIGCGRLPDIIGLFPGDGYGGEGSTYTSHVNTPLAYWTAEFLQQILGRDVSSEPFKPNATTLRKLLEVELHLVSPGGQLAPWDHYGWQPAVNASAFAYLARISGNPRYLALIEALGIWPDPGYLAWGADDPLWTLLWWPEEYNDYAEKELPEELFGWFLPKTGAALDDCKRKTRLMQVWDRCAESIAGVGRGQVNPNHIIFELDGEAVFQDGVPAKGKSAWELPAEKVLANLSAEERQRHLNYIRSISGSNLDWRVWLDSMAPGLMCGCNGIVIDDEFWYGPEGTRVGRAEFYAVQDDRQTVTADAAEYYRPRYDVEQMRRSSLWDAKHGFGVVLDTCRAGTSHRWTWQCLMRPFLELEGDSARLTLPNGQQILFAWQPGPKAELSLLDNFPDTHEQRSQRLTLDMEGDAVEFAFLIAPGAGSASIRRADDLITLVIDGQTHEFSMEDFEPMEAAAPDVTELSDVQVERDLQLAGLEARLTWQAEASPEANDKLSRIDGCCAQLAAAPPNAELLQRELESGDWPVQLAAAEALGRLGVEPARAELRRLLAAEHAIAPEELYPPDSVGGEAAGKRWRLKAALVTALGRLGDRDAVPLMARIIADNRDFYPVYSAAAQALGRIGGPEAKAALAPALKDTEINTRMRARHSRRILEGN